MTKFKIALVIDKVEFKYFEFNKLVTSFWIIKECNERNWDVFITTPDQLLLDNNIPMANLFKTQLTTVNGQEDIIKEEQSTLQSLNNFDMVLFRPDPPVDMNYIFSTYILDYIDTKNTIVLNSPSGIRKANEKLYINNFPFAIPENITTSKISTIKEFLNEYNEIIVKPLNKCFGKNVFYLKKGDKNTNTILDMITDSETTVVMAQKYLPKAKEGDKRVIMIGGKVYDETVTKVSGKDDFKFNTHNDEFLKKSYLSDAERVICEKISPKLVSDGLLLVGIDMIDSQITEINVTSPCFFIKEINSMFNIQLEKRVVDYMENLIAIKQLKKEEASFV